MPRKKPLVPKRRYYSRDLKRRVIYQAEVLGYTSTEISINLDIPLRVIQRVKQTWNEIGEVCKDRTAIGRAPLMHPEHCEVSNSFTYGPVSNFTSESQFMLALLEHSPDIYLDELQEQLEEQHNLKVSISTLSNTLKRLGITSKKVSGSRSHQISRLVGNVIFLVGLLWTWTIGDVQVTLSLPVMVNYLLPWTSNIGDLCI